MTKYLWFILALVLAVLFFGTCADAYEAQPGDRIIVVRDGKQIGNMSRSEYKVVKIESDKKVQEERRQFVVRALKDRKYKQKHNSVILHGGVGYTGNLTVSHANNQFDVWQQRGPVGGATYCYTMNTNGVCFTGFTNNSGFLGFKKDW